METDTALVAFAKWIMDLYKWNEWCFDGRNEDIFIFLFKSWNWCIKLQNEQFVVWQIFIREVISMANVSMSPIYSKDLMTLMMKYVDTQGHHCSHEPLSKCTASTCNSLAGKHSHWFYLHCKSKIGVFRSQTLTFIICFSYLQMYLCNSNYIIII